MTDWLGREVLTKARPDGAPSFFSFISEPLALAAGSGGVDNRLLGRPTLARSAQPLHKIPNHKFPRAA